MKHPNRAPFDPAFKAVRPLVIERDGGRCVKCSSGVRIEVHHVNGYEDNDPANLQTLCYFCHGVAPMGDEYWTWKKSGEDGWSDFFKKSRAICPDLTEDYLREVATEINKYQRLMETASARIARQAIRQATGRCEGRKPYGQKPDEEECFSKMRSLRAGGLTFDRVAEALNQAGFVTRYGKHWIGATVCQILARDRA